jgi:acetyl esterase/lipase
MDPVEGVVDAATKPLASGAGGALLAARYGPELIRGALRLVVNPRRIRRRMRGHSETASVLAHSLADVTDHPLGVTEPGLRQAFRWWLGVDGSRITRGLAYGPEKGQVLDVWRSPHLDPATPAPVLVFVPGGGWVHGSTLLQGHVLLASLAAQGWVCVAAGYRASPAHRWPAHIEDVKRALAWTHRTIAEHGGDPGRIAIAGSSAGGHLAALAGLTMGDPTYQPGFEGEPDGVDAVIGMYGRYDWESRDTPERQGFMTFLEKVVVHARQQDVPDVFAAASPIHRAGPHAPPFLVIHGRSDAVIPVRQARAFVERLREVSKQAVAYAELPGTGHGFDIVDPFRASHMARAVALFLRTVQARADTDAVA